MVWLGEKKVVEGRDDTVRWSCEKYLEELCATKIMPFCLGSNLGKNSNSRAEETLPWLTDAFCAKSLKKLWIIFSSILLRQGCCGIYLSTFLVCFGLFLPRFGTP